VVFCLSFSASWSAVQAQSLDEASRLSLWDPSAATLSPSAPSGGVSRLRLFRFTPGFLSDPIGLQEDDTPGIPGVPSTASPALAQPDDGPDWLQIGMGNDNPYLDMRRPGDPGGVGYYRVNTQVRLVDSATTACSVGFQTVTPAGIQFAGAPDGATVVSPAFSVFHAVSESTAIQGFVAKNVPISNSDNAMPLQRNLQYGMAVQRPIAVAGPEGLRNLFLSVGAMGQVHPQGESFKVAPNLDVLPGLHWHLSENWWLSGGVLVPVGPTRTAPGQWQFTCSLRF
jgi:hypothetical protein